MQKNQCMMSEQEFEFQTENIDKRGFKRRKAAKRAVLVAVLCIGVAVTIWGAVKGIQFWHAKTNEKIAAETYSTIREARLTGSHKVGETVYTDIVNDITDFSFENDNTVKVWILGLNPEKEKAFKKAFPDAKRVVLEEGQLTLSNTNLTPKEKIAPNIRAEITGQSDRDATLIIENTSKLYDYVHSGHYRLERFIDGEWYKVPEVRHALLTQGNKIVVLPDPNHIQMSTLVAYTIYSSRTSAIPLDWSNRYGRLPDGKYRLIKSVDVQDAQTRDDSYLPSYTFAVEFEIK